MTIDCFSFFKLIHLHTNITKYNAFKYQKQQKPLKTANNGLFASSISF